MVIAGDFSALADHYSKYREGYHDDVLSALLGLFPKAPHDLDVIDVGAGTGIWTRMMACRRCRCHAVEPNAEMREAGRQSNGELTIVWLEGSAERVPLAPASCDWLTMASSFHWADFDLALTEFHRLLRPGGWFTCLWNPRAVESHPVTLDIENTIERIVPELNRKSSGRSRFTSELSTRLSASGQFRSPIFMEAQATVDMPRERYLGVWDSVNDIRAQAGEQRWEEIRAYIRKRTEGMSSVPCVYLTRAWSCQRVAS